MTQLTQGLTPQKIALTIAIGGTIAMFPILGTTTLLCVVAGVFMKLNQPIMQAVNYAVTPLHIPFIFYSFRWGERLFDVPHTPLELHAMRRMLVEQPLQFLQDYSVNAFHAIVVWALLAPFWGLTVYYVALAVIRTLARARAEAAARAAAKTPEHPVP